MNILQTVESPLTQEALNQTPYFKACLKESMRVAPIVSGTARTAGRDLVLNGYQIPQDVIYMAKMWMIKELILIIYVCRPMLQ